MLAPDAVWYDDVRVLLRRPDEFWPAVDQSPEERLNSMVRLLLYAGLAVYAYGRNPNHLVFALASVVLVSLAYRGATEERCGEPGTRGRGCARPLAGARAGALGIAADDYSHADRVPPKQQPRRLACTRSTPDNPFANFLVADLARDPGRPAACRYDEHKHEIETNFNRGLVRNAYDLYDKENSQRQFMTMPVTTSAPDTIAFAQFAYGGAGRRTCKEDPTRCTGAFP